MAVGEIPVCWDEHVREAYETALHFQVAGLQLGLLTFACCTSGTPTSNPSYYFIFTVF